MVAKYVSSGSASGQGLPESCLRANFIIPRVSLSPCGLDWCKPGRCLPQSVYSSLTWMLATPECHRMDRKSGWLRSPINRVRERLRVRGRGQWPCRRRRIRTLAGQLGGLSRAETAKRGRDTAENPAPGWSLRTAKEAPPRSRPSQSRSLQPTSSVDANRRQIDNGDKSSRKPVRYRDPPL
jgi:hypothetical protein